MNVVMLNDFAYANGGASQVALTEALGLAQKGVQVHFFSAVGPPDPALERAGVRVHVTGQKDILSDGNRWKAAARGIWNRPALESLADFLSPLDRGRTLVHLHSWTKALSASVVRLALRQGFRVVGSLHDYFMACPNGGFYHYPDRAICTRVPLSMDCVLSNCDQRSYPQKLWRVARQHVTDGGGIPSGLRGFVYSTEFSLEKLKPYLPAQALFKRLPNPIDMPKGEPARPAGNRAFTAVGRLAAEKGMVLLARAAAQLGVESVFVGEGDRREEVEEANPKALLTGWVGRDQVVERIRKARALVFPSLLYETQGMAVWEAASQGIPALVPDSCAAREGVEDGVTGLWFKGGDWKDLGEKMGLLADDSLVERMGKAAYERYWADPMTPDRHTTELISFYQEILNRE